MLLHVMGGPVLNAEVIQDAAKKILDKDVDAKSYAKFLKEKAIVGQFDTYFGI